MPQSGSVGCRTRAPGASKGFMAVLAARSSWLDLVRSGPPRASATDQDMICKRSCSTICGNEPMLRSGAVAPEQHVEGASTTVPALCRRVGHHALAVAALVQPPRHHVPEDAAAGLALAGHDEHAAPAFRLRPLKEGDEVAMRRLLRLAVQVED